MHQAYMPRPPAAPASQTLVINGEGNLRAMDGMLDLRSIELARHSLEAWLKPGKSRKLDLAKLSGLDTTGALFLCELRDRKVELTHASAEHSQFLELIGGLERKPLPSPKKIPRWREIVIELGKGVDAVGHEAYDVIVFIARALNALLRALVHPSLLRPAAISKQISEIGIKALPIVGVMAIMISIVIGYQGLVQLRPYGGDDFMINLVAVSMLREMGVLITAIMVAGRSGSAFAAEIGVMKSREEIDALEVMGLGAMELLVVPRLIAIMIALPLLTFFADLMGLLGGAILANAVLDISPMPYLDRLHLAVDRSDLFVGLIKAPIFAFCIGAVGCMHGLRVGGSAESVGRETTRAVVKAIFIVIILDAVFSVLFERLGV